jgi:hypothetical protein
LKILGRDTLAYLLAALVANNKKALSNDSLQIFLMIADSRKDILNASKISR